MDALTVNVGGAGFELLSWSYKQTPVVNDRGRRSSTRVEISGEGRLSAESPAALAAAIAAARIEFDQPGRDLVIRSLGGAIEASVPASRCLDGGPHLELEVGPGDSPLAREVKFSCNAEVLPHATPPDPDTDDQEGPTNSFSERVAVRPDGLIAVTRRGEVHGVRAMAHLLDVELPAFERLFPRDLFVVSHEAEQSIDAGQRSVRYSLSAQQLASRLPGSPAAQAVEGSASVRTERDEHGRVTELHDFDLAVVGDPRDLVPLLRPDGPIRRESVAIELLRERRLRASFQVHRGDGTDLLTWQQSIDVAESRDTFEERRYPGAAAIAVRRPPSLTRITQTGSATAAGRRFVIPPEPLIDRLAESPRVTFDASTPHETRTTWSYQMLAEPVITLERYAGDLGRPERPRFLGPGAGEMEGGES